MTRARWLLPIAAAAIVVGCSSSPPGVRVTNARIPQPPSGDVAVVYMTIHNTSGDADTLESATSSASTSATVMRTERKGLVEEMLPGGPVTIAGGADLTLKTGGSHLMLEHVQTALHVGDTVTVKLRFDRAGTVTVRAPVVTPLAAAAG